MKSLENLLDLHVWFKYGAKNMEGFFKKISYLYFSQGNIYI